MSKLKYGINKVSNRDYHADKQFLSSSNLKTLLDNPQRFYKEKILGEREDVQKNAFDEGTLVHSMILEPDLVAKEFAFFEGMRKAGAEWEDFKTDPANKGKLLMSAPQKKRCEFYVEPYFKHDTAKALIEGGEAEHTVCQPLNEVDIKVRCDYINVDKGYIVDVKTSGFAVDRDSFALTVDKWGYDLSAALYLKVVEAYYKKPFDFYFIALAKKEQDCQVFRLSKESRAIGEQAIVEALNIYKRCKKSGVWAKEEKQVISAGDYEILEV